MSVYIYSTLTSGQIYTLWDTNGYGKGQTPRPLRSIEVAGGANVANKKTLVTPKGVMTEISDEVYGVLRENPVFKRHKARGYIKVEIDEHDPNEAARDMTSQDQSAPMRPEDFEEAGKNPKILKRRGRNRLRLTLRSSHSEKRRPLYARLRKRDRQGQGKMLSQPLSDPRILYRNKYPII